MNILICEGEILTCPDGHPMFRALRDVAHNETMRAADFKALPGVEQPEKGHAAKPCPICGKQPFEPRGDDKFLPYVNGKLRGD